MSWPEWCETTLLGLRAASRGPDAGLPAGGERGHEALADDLLGMCRHRRVRVAASRALDSSGPGLLTDAGLAMTGALKRQLGDWFGAEDILLTPTGAAAREVALAGLATRGVTAFVTDTERRQFAALVSDSINLESFAEADGVSFHPGLTGTRSVVFTESVSWQTGAELPTEHLVRVAASADALVVVDETFQLLQPPVALSGAPVLRTASLLPLLGVPLGLVAGPTGYIQLLRASRRGGGSRRFVTAVTIAAASEAMAIAASAEGASLRQRLRIVVDRIRPGHGSPVFVAPMSTMDEAQRCADRLVADGVCARGLLLGRTKSDERPVVWIAVTIDASEDQIGTVREIVAQAEDTDS